MGVDGEWEWNSLQLRLLALESCHKAGSGNYEGDVNIKHIDLHRKELYLRLIDR